MTAHQHMCHPAPAWVNVPEPNGRSVAKAAVDQGARRQEAAPAPAPAPNELPLIQTPPPPGATIVVAVVTDT
eukprot:5543165-Prymnesium_polylepis.1